MQEQSTLILVTGSNGQLGNEFKSLAESFPEYSFVFTDVNDLDITKKDEVFTFFRKHKPAFCFNCAAYTAVDKAEEDKQLAYLINSTAVQHLAIACKLHDTKLIHFSTDYAYDSVTERPILETDPNAPKSIYGLSKRAGEEVLEQSDIDWICLRISWLYSSYGHNFVKTMLRLGKERNTLHIVSDQVGAPTYAGDLAASVMIIIKEDKGYRQHYNFSNSGITNWADFARKIMSLKDLECDIQNTSTTAYGAPAPRPLWSVMSHNKIKETFGINIPSWQESLKKCLSLIDRKSLVS